MVLPKSEHEYIPTQKTGQGQRWTHSKWLTMLSSGDFSGGTAIFRLFYPTPAISQSFGENTKVRVLFSMSYFLWNSLQFAQKIHDYDTKTVQFL
ncbi:hypothetical protein DP117_28290 [Brasilonema sp. UFV-L1]|nr:hypothetical protein [Brasilonema sp. UFV-L1]